MSVPSDPEVRRLRGIIASASRDGLPDKAAEGRRKMAVILTERSLREVAPTLTTAERAEYASILFADGAA